MSNPVRMAAFSDGASPSLTYEPYFGLREKPFSLAADPRFLYTGLSHERAFNQLLAGIRRREGLIVLSGEIGTGKTTLCRSVLGQLDRRTFTTFVRDPFLSREDLLKTLLIDFGVMSIADLKSGRLAGAARPDLSYPLYEFLDSLVPLQAFAVLIIDEAQNLSPALLEEIRILSELEAREKLLQVVLVGQPELRASLKLPQLRQVDQRISVRCELAPLTPDEAAKYIVHRLGVAAGGEPRVSFGADAMEAVWQASAGVPRVVNLVCDRALHHTWEAKVQRVDRAMVVRALTDLDRSWGDDAAEEHRLASPAAGPPFDAATIVRPPRELDTYTPPPLTELADPLSEFSHEVDLAASRRGWTRAATLALAIMVAGVAGGMGLWYAEQRLRSDVFASGQAALPASPSPLLAPGLPPLVPVIGVAPSGPANTASMPGAYVIQVASFQSDRRAASLVDELKGAGYEARAIATDLGASRGGIWHQVVVGPYPSRERAESDVLLIRERPSYKDAHVIEQAISAREASRPGAGRS